MPTKDGPVTRQNLHYQTYPAQQARISMIATPIGNLADITPRALQAMREADELWCEDTRHTQNLLNALKVEHKRLCRVDQHTTAQELTRMLERVEREQLKIGVVTDAGTPGVSDPGARLIQLVSGFPSIRVEPLPGPSAVTAFVSIAGFEENSFLFNGFFPRDEKEGLELLSRLKNSGISRNWIFFESPQRIRAAIETLNKWCKEAEITPKFVFVKELSKLHETVFMGEGNGFLENLLQQDFDERGEWVFGMILPKDCVIVEKPKAEWSVSLECLIQAGVSTKDAAQIIAERFFVAKKLAYKEALDAQKKMKKSDTSA